MLLDEVHKQNNEIVKGAGLLRTCHHPLLKGSRICSEADGLITNPAAFKRWMVADPEQARILAEFEDIYFTPDQYTVNHEQGHASQETLTKQVTNRCNMIVTMGNPFMDSSNVLMTLDNYDCMNEMVVQALHSMESLGKVQYSKYVNDVLIERKFSIHKAVTKNQLPLFKSCHFTMTNLKAKQQLQQLKSGCNQSLRPAIHCITISLH